MCIPQVTPATRSPQASPSRRSLGAPMPTIGTDQQTDGRVDDQLVGASPPFQRTLQAVAMVAPTDATVLIQGETGTGKELIARAVHRLSPRRHAPFVTVNCAAIPSGLLESELFGHVRGGFTGALTPTVGRVQLAHTGTLFLDEIGDLPLEVQPKLLRFLQEHTFEKLGSPPTMRVDVRVVAATNQDLLHLVRERRFRADLYDRLHVFPITIAPRRDRSADIPALVRSFVRQCSRRLHKPIDHIPADVMAALERYHWPGNVRELQNVIERAVIMSTGGVLRPPLAGLTPVTTPTSPVLTHTLAEAEREHIVAVLRDTRGVIGGRDGAAARLGVPQTTLMYRMRKLGIAREPFREAS
jgi:formate hydrogenlyase transcriptional activator